MRAEIGLKEVAERAGVSMRTVSNVVRDTGRFSEATRARVLRASGSTTSRRPGTPRPR
ncbi:LacI family DNA-binding transcriptional regulator [Streptomyces hyaluromycini]|uniref:LacI family DNA-binding transcriptional regulator n=1 Tax=Streptomyces hyaluromycini TaxID=1377993 RepID=UPI00123822BF|nr:LacI family DNA-binding transcriptional regulator [Streptomyces hyaluromycini]